MKKTTMDDLKNAILNLLLDAQSDNGALYSVSAYPLRILQAEYNIFFVEPDEEQLEVI